MKKRDSATAAWKARSYRGQVVYGSGGGGFRAGGYGGVATEAATGTAEASGALGREGR